MAVSEYISDCFDVDTFADHARTKGMAQHVCSFGREIKVSALKCPAYGGRYGAAVQTGSD
ncbi:hypothetical protein DESC_810053 [Desulfosarcina cetonica]|nr:hypothetical protein DESC_810053 [Desulfosarcina cetonica]